MRRTNKLVLGTTNVLVAADKGKRTGKTIREEDGRVVSDGNDHSFLYTWLKLVVDAAGAWLERLRSKADRFPIIGTPVPDWAKGDKRRRVKGNFIDAPCFMLPVDVDKVPFKVEGDPLDGINVARQVMAYLDIVEDVQGFWHLTASHMLPGKGIRLRLWIVLDEPMTAKQMKALAKRLWQGKVDLAIYTPNAEIFTTDPEFEDGIEDPMQGRDRSGPLEGSTKWKPPVEIPQEPKRGPGRPRKAPYDRYVEMLKAAGLYIGPATEKGYHYIRCINEADHSGEPKDTDTMYMEAGTGGYAKPRLYCQHDHCKDQGDYHDRFMAHLGLSGDLTVDDIRYVLTSGLYIMMPIRMPIVAAAIGAVLPAIKVDEDKYVAAAEWIKQHNWVTTLTWAPGADEILPEQAWTDAGPIYRAGLSSLNMYLPSQHMLPVDVDSDAIVARARRWIKHLMRVFPDGWLHILTVLAFKVQNPGVKVNHCIVFDGAPRIGKDSILVPVVHAIGAHNCSSIGPAELVGRFNKFERSVLCVINETSDSGELNKYKFYEHTKAMFASPPLSRSIDEKNLGAYYIPNVAFYVITTNDAKASLHIPVSDGRYYVAASPIANRLVIDPDGTYFDGYYRWLYREGGLAAVADYLMTIDVSDFDPKLPPPRTQAWWNVVSASNSEEDVALFNALDAMKWPDVLTIEELNHRMGGFVADTANAMRALVYRLNRLEQAYVVVANETAQDGRWKVHDLKATYYARRELPVPERIKAVKARIRADADARRKALDAKQRQQDDDNHDLL